MVNKLGINPVIWVCFDYKALSLLLINEGDDRATRTEKNYSNKLPGETLSKVSSLEKDFDADSY
jgi:hypothetical protein